MSKFMEYRKCLTPKKIMMLHKVVNIDCGECEVCKEAIKILKKNLAEMSQKKGK